MAVNLTIDGNIFNYPEVGEIDWGNQATSWASAVSTLLTGFRGPTTPIADAGQLRLGNEDRIAWRDAGDTSNKTLRVDASGDLVFNDGITDISLTAAAAGDVTGPASSDDNAVARFDGLTGKVIQNSSVTISDAGLIAAADANLTAATITTLDSTTINALTDITLGGSSLNSLFISAVAGAVNNRIPTLSGGSGLSMQTSTLSFDGTTLSNNTGSLTLDNDLTISSTGTHSVSSEFAGEVYQSVSRPNSATAGVNEILLNGSSGSFSTTSAAAVDVTNLSGTITTAGKPVFLKLNHDGGPSNSSLIISGVADNVGTVLIGGTIAFIRDGGTVVGDYSFSITQDRTQSLDEIKLEVPGAIQHIDFVGAGTYDYKVQALVYFSGPLAANPTIEVRNFSLVAYEL